MANINEILARAESLRKETALNSIDPERAGGIMYDTLLALNELWLQQGAALVISKIYASVAAMEADTAPVSDLTGKPLRPGQIVVIASSDSDNGSVYRYNGTESPSWSLVGNIGNLEPVDNLESDSATLPLAAHQGKVLDGKISQLGQEVDGRIVGLFAKKGGYMTAISSIAGYPRNSGEIVLSPGFRTDVYDVSKIPCVVVYNNHDSIANFSILFSTDPNFETITHGKVLYEGVGVVQKVPVPAGATYMAIDTRDTFGYVREAFLIDYPDHPLNLHTTRLEDIVGASPKSLSALSVASTIAGYPNTDTKSIYPQSGFTTNVYDVTDVDFVLLKHNCNAALYGIALSNSEDFEVNNIISMLSYNSVNGSDSEIMINVSRVNYIAVANNITRSMNQIDIADFSTTPGLAKNIDERFFLFGDEDADVHSTIPGYYPRYDNKALFPVTGFSTSVYDVSSAQLAIIRFKDIIPAYYGVAFSNDPTTFDSSSKWYAYPSANGTMAIVVPDGVSYMAIEQTHTEWVYFGTYNQETLMEMQGRIVDLQHKVFSPQYDKTCIYIGDSISTSDNYKWKGYLEREFNFKYTRDIGSSSATTDDELWAANGGITVVPPVTEPTLNFNKSIWYRCAGGRMAIYDFDIISLFGGTNDMNSGSEEIALGSVNDTPYVDSLDGFDPDKAATLTATRPETLTFAAALMGCIEMLHRDFPGKTIILPTVLPCYGTYGNAEDAQGVRLSERMAKLQMQIAYKYSGEDTTTYPNCAYGVIGIPWYWGKRTPQSCVAGVLSKDGVHPNEAQARLMRDAFASTLLL